MSGEGELKCSKAEIKVCISSSLENQHWLISGAQESGIL